MGDKRAIQVRLGINNGRHSPNREPPKHVLVYVDAKVNWFFVEGAFVLQSVHRRDHTQLEKDFDLYLKRPDSRGDICLHPSREITEYGIKKDDELEFRHKTLPISVNIDLHPGEKRTIEVNSGYPVMDIVLAICEQISIGHSLELSLALEQRNSDDTATLYQWLDPQRSLNAQGIKNGDTLLLRKKFFILNDDIEEAVSGNPLLATLLYHQIHDMFVGDSFVGLTGIDKDKALAQVCCYLHHIEQKDESISDENVVSKFIPKCRQLDESFPSRLITVYFQERIGTLPGDKAKSKLLELFAPSQSILMTYYPVKVEEDANDYVLACHSTAVTLCTVENSKLQPVDDKEWRYINIRGTNCTNKQRIVSVHALGSRHEFNTRYSFQISSYVSECLELTKQKAARNMQKKPRTPTPVISTATVAPVAVDPPKQPSPEPVHKPPTATEQHPPPEEPKPVMEQALKQPGRPQSQEIVVIDNVTPSPCHPSPVIIHIPPPPPLPPTPSKNSEPLPPPVIVVNNDDEEEEEEKKDLMTPITALSFTPTLHIPEYFGLDFRDVLRDYRLFHIIVMDKDKRTLLLNIKKPVREVIATACTTFTIHNHQRQRFWLPQGKKNVLRKYGGKPKKRAGKFIRKTVSVPITPPELALESDKSLEQQYDLKLKPLVLHLHYREPQVAEEEDTDLDVPHGHDEVDMGMEWPRHETTDVRSYRQFYQSWCGAVQGAYPMVKVDAIRLAALLTHVYYGDRTLYKSWPPSDYDVKMFLPEMYWKTLGIASDVEKAYKRLSGKTPQECIIEASEFCSRKITHQGIFYEVSVPGHDQVFHRKKMQPQLFGINSHGVFSINRDNGELIFTHRFSDIFDWKYGENTFKLNFSAWSTDYDAYTYQREEILDTLQLYISMTRSGIISQAPSRPPSVMMEDPVEGEGTMDKKITNLTLALGRTNSPQFSINISVSPESSPGSATPTSPMKTLADEAAHTPDSTRDIVMSAV